MARFFLIVLAIPAVFFIYPLVAEGSPTLCGAASRVLIRKVTGQLEFSTQSTTRVIDWFENSGLQRPAGPGEPFACAAGYWYAAFFFHGSLNDLNTAKTTKG